jgi:anti-anti-sigma factor
MNLRVEDLPMASLVIPQGRLDFDAAPGFQEASERLLGTRPPAVIVDCAALDYVSSAGLRAVLLVARAAQRAGVSFGLCALQPAVREVFELSGFTRIIAVYADRATALTQVQQGRS